MINLWSKIGILLTHTNQTSLRWSKYIKSDFLFDIPVLIIYIICLVTEFKDLTLTFDDIFIETNSNIVQRNIFFVVFIPQLMDQ